MSIIITQHGKQAQRIEQSRFDVEDNLQQYIFDNPESLPLYEVKEDIKLLVLAREFDTESGPIDAIGVDKDGDIYVIETKLYKNPDKRTVVAQVLDYGASLWRHAEPESFVTAVEEAARETWGTDITVKLQDFFCVSVEEAGQIIDSMKNNLKSGNFRFVVLMDKLHDRLKDLVVFLNANTRFSIYAVEIEYYKFDKYEIVIPKLFGSEVKKEVAGPSGHSSRRVWDESSFFQHAEASLSKETLAAVRMLYAFCKDKASSVTWGTGAVTGSFNPKFPTTGVRSPFTVYSSGILQLSFAYIDEGRTGQEFRNAWAKVLARQLTFPVTAETLFKNIDESLWVPKVEEFIETFERLAKL